MYLVYRTETFAKLFFIVSFTGLFMYVALAFYSFHTAYSNNLSQVVGQQDRLSKQNVPVQKSELIKYILVWKLRQKINIEETQTPFLINKCPHVNCYITSNRDYLEKNYTNFDAIVFDLSAQTKWQYSLLPKYRLPYQKYVFYSNLPSNDYPICNVIVNNFFNWTWSYKLNSDILSPFIVVHDMHGQLLAPKEGTVWKDFAAININKREPDNYSISMKSKAVIWILKDCEHVNNKFYIQTLTDAFKGSNLTLDIYGCGYKPCPDVGCVMAVELYYFFYIVYEPSMTEDYVTDDVLIPYQSNAVPIMIGGANYKRFLPTGSYIDFQGMTGQELVRIVDAALKTQEKFLDYLNWKDYYNIHHAFDQGYCKLCSLLNDPQYVSTYSNYENFRKWWYRGPLKEKCVQEKAEQYSGTFYHFNMTQTTMVLKL